jgi:hypothetical protein
MSPLVVPRPYPSNSLSPVGALALQQQHELTPPPMHSSDGEDEESQTNAFKYAHASAVVACDH